MVFVDVHCHLDFKDFNKDREELMQKFKENNIKALTNTLNPQNYEETKEIFKNYPQVQVCSGLYPQDAEKITDKEFEEYIKKIREDSPIAIGEVGLDRHHTKDPKLWEVQENRFRRLIELGIELDIPLIIHTRKAEEHTLNILEEYIKKHNFRKFNLHCFMGKKKLINKIRELKIYCSIPLIVLNTQSFRLLVEELPIGQLLVETDSPYLNPSRKRNSSLNIPIIYKEIAKIKGLDSKEIEHIIYRNYMKLFM